MFTKILILRISPILRTFLRIDGFLRKILRNFLFLDSHLRIVSENGFYSSNFSKNNNLLFTKILILRIF